MKMLLLIIIHMLKIVYKKKKMYRFSKKVN